MSRLNVIIELLNSLNVSLASSIASSLQVHYHRWAGPAFARRPTFGTTTTSPVEGNHAVYKRDESAGGAGLTSKTAVEKTVSRLMNLQRSRDLSSRVCRDHGLNLPAQTDDMNINIFKFVTQQARDILKTELVAASLCRISEQRKLEYIVSSGTHEFVVTASFQDGTSYRLYCSCSWSYQWLLPCRHMIHVKDGQVDLEDIHPRWLLRYWRGEWSTEGNRGPHHYIGAILKKSPTVSPEVILIIDEPEKSDEDGHNIGNTEPIERESFDTKEGLYRLFQEFQSEAMMSKERLTLASKLLKDGIGQLSTLATENCKTKESRFKSFYEK